MNELAALCIAYVCRLGFLLGLRRLHLLVVALGLSELLLCRLRLFVGLLAGCICLLLHGLSLLAGGFRLLTCNAGLLVSGLGRGIRLHHGRRERQASEKKSCPYCESYPHYRFPPVPPSLAPAAVVTVPSVPRLPVRRVAFPLRYLRFSSIEEAPLSFVGES